jgi:hypothetical protein
MASVRSLKKDIDFLMSLVLEDCISVMEKYPLGDQEEIMEIARKIIQDHRALRARVVSREIRKHPGQSGKYLSGVVEEMYTLSDASLERLSVFVKSRNNLN